ncbi:uncharacterized protein LOC128213492 [Mya arenaria]|uniref:uncharacterized protein LOC128213492 n=1 Tax=Mya arenaria TaxID=6604 RepID=UPI0022E28D3D|nr:uncharacterized protein LOC128213492 [Mya arenaria]
MGCFRKILPNCLIQCLARQIEPAFADAAIKDTLFFKVPEAELQKFLDYGPEHTYLDAREYIFMFAYETEYFLAQPDANFELKTYYFGDIALKGWAPCTKKPWWLSKSGNKKTQQGTDATQPTAAQADLLSSLTAARSLTDDEDTLNKIAANGRRVNKAFTSPGLVEISI